MITAAQIRAARALIGLSQSELAALAGVGVATVQRVENAQNQVGGSAQTIFKLEKALESKGVVFIAEDKDAGIGIRLSLTERSG